MSEEQEMTGLQKLAFKIAQYAEKHDLSEEEIEKLRKKLSFDINAYGTCQLDMEKGRVKPHPKHHR